MLGLIVVVIMMGFPTAFTLMGLGNVLRLHRVSTSPGNPGCTIGSSI
jgi:TRAP-type mannitol/chloroaromatic compound transport system permease large subunit